MNILYLGPYRQNDDIGVLSRIYLNSISTKFSVCSRPVYLNNNANNSQNIFITEKCSSTDFDVLVQHLPIDNLAINSNFSKNICIPIIDSKLLNSDQTSKLNFFDQIFIDNYFLYRQIKTINIAPSKYRLLGVELPPEIFHTNKYNLSLYDFSTKLYTILDFQKNLDMINDLCASFVSMSKNIKNLSLLLFLYNIDNNLLQGLNNRIKDLYSAFNSKLTTINIVPIGINNDLQSLILCHNTGDVFLDISETNKIPLNYHIAKNLDRKILDPTTLNYSMSLFRNNTYSPDGYDYVSGTSIYDNLTKILANNSTQHNIYKDYNTIDKILYYEQN